MRYTSGQVLDILKQYWGYDSFRPLQEEIIFSVLEDRESLTVLPTGGGKSLCFQLPALLKDGMAVVISPLISLMKDQVDALKDIGIAAEYLNSSLSPKEHRKIIGLISEQKIKLLYISPERLQGEGTIDLLSSIPIAFFVIDEAHCISHWGHDFRADYRNLRIIRKVFPYISVHAFTATATKEVRDDIVAQLGFDNAKIHIAPVDRANLTYRITPRSNIIKQITDTLEKHPGEPGIIYCLRRDDVDTISKKLNKLGFKNRPYHAGLTDEIRHANQDKFINEDVDIIVATVAFGMGIDRSNIRFIIHAAMPKSLEYYHQETGRAGRDSLASYCYMFFGGNDYRVWKFLSEKSANQDTLVMKLNTVYNFCSKPQCRHKAIANYFNQAYEKDSCESCDYCLGEFDMMEDPLKVGQDILFSVYEATQDISFGFGAGHIASILKGHLSDNIERRGHHNLSRFGAMAGQSIEFIRYMIEQMIGQDFLVREGEYSTLSLTESGVKVLRGEVTPLLVKPLLAKKKKEIAKKTRELKEREWQGIDHDLFQLLREKRAELAKKQGVPAFIIFGDRSLKDMAAIKPTTKEQFTAVFGVGEKKARTYAGSFTAVIKGYIKA
ncbi:MAG: ATP-dependent DNA helicase [Candidatus Omnitrophica bacterium]|nr:ATP-dependent DNA helicase [Candidatus Omnitrophota bacterium]MBU1932908.1 ATP-dependent DNA helicase [Candidatus Omnitrophota bacterium]